MSCVKPNKTVEFSGEVTYITNILILRQTEIFFCTKQSGFGAQTWHIHCYLLDCRALHTEKLC